MTRYSVLYGQEYEARLKMEQKLHLIREQLEYLQAFIHEKGLSDDLARWTLDQMKKRRNANAR